MRRYVQLELETEEELDPETIIQGLEEVGDYTVESITVTKQAEDPSVEEHEHDHHHHHEHEPGG